MRLILGFIPLLDCASLVATVERGFAAEEGLDVALVRETSWANIRDRLIVGHFDAAHMLGPMAVACTLGVGHIKVPVAAPLALGYGGNAITVTTRLWEQMLGAGAVPGGTPSIQGRALKQVLAERAAAQQPPLTFGMVYPFSCHNFLLRYWLAACGIDPDRDVRLVVIPPPFLVDAMRMGQIDGFCVGEPWNSVAVHAEVGAIVTPTTAIWPHSGEKVLACRREWAEQHPRQLAALVRAVRRASQWSEKPEHFAELARLLAQPRYVGAPAELLRQGLANRLTLTAGAAAVSCEDFYVAAGNGANFPWTSHASWFYSQMVRWGYIKESPQSLVSARGTYRPDIYRAAFADARDLPERDARVEEFFDGRNFDPAETP